MAVSLWDFAGQQEYYVTHTFFIDADSTFMVLYDSSKFASSESDYERLLLRRAGRL